MIFTFLNNLCLAESGGGCGCDENGDCWAGGDPSIGGWYLAISYSTCDDDKSLSLTEDIRVLFKDDEDDGGWNEYLDGDTDQCPDPDDPDHSPCPVVFNDGDTYVFDLDWVEVEEPFRLFDLE